MVAMRTGIGFLLVDSSFSPVFIDAFTRSALSAVDDENFKLDEALASLKAAVEPYIGLGEQRTEFDFAGRRWKWMQFSCNCCSGGPQMLHAFVLGSPVTELPYTSAVAAMYRLTPREAEAFEVLLQGLSVKEVAQKMGINPSTAKTFLRSISGKMGVTSRSELMSEVLNFTCSESFHCPFRITLSPTDRSKSRHKY